MWRSYNETLSQFSADAHRAGHNGRVTTLTPEASDELHDLRRRAYGPDAGAGLDSEEIERLHQLEGRSRVASGVVPVAPAVADELDEPAPESAAPPAPVAPEADAAAEGEPIDEGGVESSTQTPPPWWRRRSLWIAAAAGVAIGVAATWGLGALRSVPPTEVLQPTDRSFDDMSDAAGQSFFAWDPATIQHYGPWHAVDVWTVTRTDGAHCLMITTASEDGRQGTFMDARCVTDGLDPQLDLWMWEGMQSYTGTDLPAESNVRFVARGGVVDVWVQPAGPREARR